MAELTTVARPYAKAVFQFASETNSLPQWLEMLNVAAQVASNERMRSVLSQPQLTAEQKALSFASVCGESLDDSGKNLIAQLADNKRLQALPAIYVLFEQLLAEHDKTIDVNVVSAFALSDAESEKIVTALGKKLGRKVALKSTVDNSLIGGLIIHAGDVVIDGSIKGKLAKLNNELNT